MRQMIFVPVSLGLLFANVASTEEAILAEDGRARMPIVLAASAAERERELATMDARLTASGPVNSGFSYSAPLSLVWIAALRSCWRCWGAGGSSRVRRGELCRRWDGSQWIVNWPIVRRCCHG